MDPMDIVGKSKEDVSLPKCELNSLDSDYAFFFSCFLFVPRNFDAIVLVCDRAMVNLRIIWLG